MLVNLVSAAFSKSELGLLNVHKKQLWPLQHCQALPQCRVITEVLGNVLSGNVFPLQNGNSGWSG
jgi:hypothetical protein